MNISLKKNWFLLTLVLVALFTIADNRELSITAGLWLKTNHGPDLVIVLIFFLSGFALDTGRIRTGISDYRGTLAAIFLIFIAAPLLTIPFSILPIQPAVLLGLFLVAVMPTTLSSGVVMTGSAKGNMAHALLITIIANSLAVITIPFTLNLLLKLIGDSRTVEIDRLSIMLKIAALVLLPLICGIFFRNMGPKGLKAFLPYTVTCSQIGIILMVWMALCTGRKTIIVNLDMIAPVVAVIITFHLALILTGMTVTYFSAINKGRRESVIIMGAQKTLPLSVILQVSLFPEYGLALVVCILHHVIHLIMDAFLSQYLKNKG